MPPRVFPWVNFTLGSIGIVAAGYALMRYTVPTPEETYNVRARYTVLSVQQVKGPAAMAPDLRRKVDANRAARIAREEDTQRQLEAQNKDPGAQKPVWADSSSRS